MGYRNINNKPNREQLEKDYKELKSLSKVGEKYRVSNKTILKWMRKYYIKRNKSSYQISTERRKRDKPSKEQLEIDYEELRNVKRVGEKYGVSPQAVLYWMRKERIKRNKSTRQISIEKKPSKEHLKQDYEELKSINKIGEKYKLGHMTIWRWMKEYGIERNKSTRQISLENNVNRPSKEQLEKDYEELKSTIKIGKKYRVGHSTIMYWMEEYGIEINKSSPLEQAIQEYLGR